MDLYFNIWKILGIAFLLFLAYTFIVVKFEKKQGYREDDFEKNK